MKKLIILSLLAITCVAQAQLPTSAKIKRWTSADARKTSIQGGDYSFYNASYLDTLKSGDTLFVIFPLFYPTKSTKYGTDLDVPYSNDLKPYLTFYWKKTGTVDTSVIVKYYQSIDGLAANSSWIQLKKGKLQSVYSNTDAVTTAKVTEYDFNRDSLYFASRYLGIQMIAKTKTGFKYAPKITLKNNAY